MWVEICFDTAGEFSKPSYLVEYGGYRIEIIRGSTTKGHNICIETAAPFAFQLTVSRKPLVVVGC